MYILYRRKLFFGISSLLAGSVLALAPGRADVGNAEADQAIRLEEIEVTAPRTSALSMAPTESRLDALQPQSSINLQTIQNSIAPTADYAMIANLAPSVTNFSTNGPGLNESKPTLRGLTDGQYNVTFDGIPFGDGNDFTHHTTSYFPAKLIGRETVDRGPGTASTIGMATFGGTIAMFSKDPRTEASFVPTLSTGSYRTQLAHFEVNTGLLPEANNSSLLASYQYMTTDGYRTFGTLRRNTYFFKYLQPVGKHTTVTFMGTYNNIKFNNPNASTLSQLQIYQLGRNFGQGNDPADNNNYYGTNHQEKHADMEYIGINSDLSNDWKLEDKVYSFNYNNVSHESPNSTSGPTKKDAGGQVKVNVVRAYGNYLAVTHPDSIGTLKTGVWFDYQHGPRYNYYVDYAPNSNAGPAVQNNILDINHAGSNGGYAWNMHYWTRTWQPYLEYEWRVTPALTFDPGVKYFSVNRAVHGPVNQDKEVNAFSYNQTFSKLLPLIAANYRIMSDWSAYAQYAQGLLTPPLAQSSVLNSRLNQVKPQQTTNYQVGSVYKNDRFNADVDGYWINYSNLPLSALNPAEIPGTPNYDSNDVIYYDARGAYYYGVEAEGTFYVGGGLSVFANGSRNYATYKGSKRRLESVPQSTGGFGFIFERAGFFASVMEKYIGPYTTYSATVSPDLPLPAGTLTTIQGGYSMFDLSLGYGYKIPHGYFIKSVKARLQVNDVFNRQVQLLKKPNANPLSSTYSVLTPRDWFLTVSAEF